MANQPLAGYNTPFRDKLLGILDHTGPSNYATGGEVIYATDLGLLGIDFAQVAAVSMSGNYTAIVLYPVNAFNSCQHINLAWYVYSTGNQAAPGTNLSGEHIRLEVIGV
jgi:hypothetical protein